MLLSLQTAPVNTPVTLAEAKAHLRVEHTDDDVLIGSLIGVLVAELDGRQSYLRRALITQTWDYFLGWFPTCARIVIPMPPLASVTYVKYFDTSNVEQTFSAGLYEVVTEGEQGYIALNYAQSWPGTYEREKAVSIRFVAGYGANTTNIPENIRQAMLIRLGELYAGRGDEGGGVGMSDPVRRLLAPSRRVVLA